MFKTKLFVGVAALALVATVAMPASAATTAELTAQINALLAQIAQLQSQVGGSSTATTATTFTSDLTVGSTGDQVTALQKFLVAGGYMTAPASYGYFGPLTKAALVKYQTAMGITPASGYFGPITRAKVNGSSTTTTTTGSTTSTTGIKTTGAEGTLSVTLNNSGVESTVYEGDSEVAILGFKVKANDSDIAVQRIKLDLGTATTIYRKIYEKLYVTVDDEVLASKELDASTVTKSGGRYYVTMADFSYVVSEDETVQFVIKADVNSSIDGGTDGDQGSYVVRLASDGVRGVDGAGIDQYAGDTDITKSVKIDGSLTEQAELKVSLDSSNTPQDEQVVATDGSDNSNYDKLPVLVIKAKATKDDIKINDMPFGVEVTGGYATATTAYLYDGSTEIGSADVSYVTTGATRYATIKFEDLDYTVSQDDTANLTLKLDVEGATVSPTTFVASTTQATDSRWDIENSDGDNVDVSGTATGNDVSVIDYGVTFTLKSVNIAADNSNDTKTNHTLTATFKFDVEALDEDVTFSGTDMATSTGFVVTKGGSTLTVPAASSSVTVDFADTNASSGNYTISDGSSDTVTVTYLLSSDSTTTGLYKVNLGTIKWTADSTDYYTTWMTGNSDWTTSTVSFP